MRSEWGKQRFVKSKSIFICITGTRSCLWSIKKRGGLQSLYSRFSAQTFVRPICSVKPTLILNTQWRNEQSHNGFTILIHSRLSYKESVSSIKSTIKVLRFRGKPVFFSTVYSIWGTRSVNDFRSHTNLNLLWRKLVCLSCQLVNIEVVTEYVTKWLPERFCSAQVV